MGRRMRVLAIVALGTALSACTMLAGLTDDYRFVDGGVSSTGEGGGTDGNDGKDGALPDGGSFRRTAAGMRRAIRLYRTASCGTQPSFDYCNDFEDGPASAMSPNAYWTGIQNSSAAPITVVAGSGVGNTHGLDIDSTTAASGSRNIYLHKTLGAALAIGTYLRYDVEFDVKVVSPVAGDYLAVGVLNFTGSRRRGRRRRLSDGRPRRAADAQGDWRDQRARHMAPRAPRARARGRGTELHTHDDRRRDIG